MSDMNTRATVSLQINGQQAQQTLQQLKENALQLSNAIAEAAAAGNKTDLKKLRRELAETKKQIREIESSTMQVENVMINLDKATPKELQKTLAILNSQLEYIGRGTSSWDAHVAKIQKVREEIARVNAEISSRTINTDRTLAQPYLASIAQIEAAMKDLQTRLRTMDVGGADFQKTSANIEMLKKHLNEATIAAQMGGRTIGEVMRNLNTASPEQLNATLSVLEKELQSMARNSPLWDSQVKKIEEVKAALNSTKTAAAMSAETMKRVMSDLNHASPRELKTTLDVLNKELQTMKVGSSAWTSHVQKINEVKMAMNRMKVAMEADGATIKRTLANLSAASPRELEVALRALNNDLETLRRGSTAWDNHTKKIREVKQELAKCRQEVATQTSAWDRFNRKMNEWQATLMGFMAVATGVIMAGRQAVRNFAEMDEQLANTRKYTGMTVEQVEQLNDNFKKLDTRTGRDQLNLFAQEAGRLGKSSMQDVQGYVEAADIISVALVDLGEGATQTIAKIASIFRIDAEMGTKDSMLAVGSAVNVLSQNCTASKPYLVEFTQRMAGVGAQAKMTVPEILAFGATLDANGQKVEMASSALGKLTMNLFQKPGEIAKQVGLDVNNFTETLKGNTTEGVIMFLERIHQLGSKDGLAVLAPMFKDLGMDGVRMSQVLSTLAEHLDMVKWEMGEANKAFNEASSATREFDIFNNTTQAKLDKAKYKLHELSIELGEKMMPVMMHIYTSSSLTLRILSTLITFISEYKGEIITLVAAVGTYMTVANAALLIDKAKVEYQKLLTLWNEKIIVGLKSLYTTMRSNPYAAIAAALVVVVGLYRSWVSHSTELEKKQRMLRDVEQDASRIYSEEMTKIKSLTKLIHDNSASVGERQNAITELQKIIPDYHASISKEGKLYEQNASVIEAYCKRLQFMAQIQAASAKLTEAETKYSNFEKNTPENITNAYFEERVNGVSEGEAAGRANASPTAYRAWKSQERSMRSEVDQLKSYIDSKTREMAAIKPIHVDLTGDGGGGGGSVGGKDTDKDKNKSKTEDKFKAEKEWKEREEALARISYAKGETNYEQYTKRMDDIAIEFYERELKHKGLSQTEKLSIEAEYYEAVKKEADDIHKMTIESEQNTYNEQMAIIKQKYVDGESSLEQYNDAIEILELQHLKRVVELNKEGTKERAEAEKAYSDKLFEQQRKRREKYEKDMQKFNESIKKYQDQYFSDIPTHQQGKYDEDMTWLALAYQAELKAAGDNAEQKLQIEEAYQKARLKLMKKYDSKELRENQSFMENLNDDVLDFLDSDLGKAITQTAELVVNQMSEIFSSLTDIIQAELDIQIAALDKRYDAEISLAEGNNYKVSKLEKEKEAEEAKLKNEANRKAYNMQVMQAIASTALGAINAYTSAAQVPYIGYILAPIAAATAVAAGMLQVASIKKQQEAAEAQGYAEGGFTPDGAVTDEVGVVHAGEWVASQKLTKNSRVRPLLEALDYAQKNNSVGSITQEQVSSSITAPIISARNSTASLNNSQSGIAQSTESNSASGNSSDNLSSVIRQLNDRLNEPFVTVNTVTGDTGIKKAQDEYEKLMRNKSPKSKK